MASDNFWVPQNRRSSYAQACIAKLKFWNHSHDCHKRYARNLHYEMVCYLTENEDNQTYFWFLTHSVCKNNLFTLPHVGEIASRLTLAKIYEKFAW